MIRIVSEQYTHPTAGIQLDLSGSGPAGPLGSQFAFVTGQYTFGHQNLHHSLRGCPMFVLDTLHNLLQCFCAFACAFACGALQNC